MSVLCFQFTHDFLGMN